jgi:EpsD family peptidyl-prolyl cis-trans isomerase
MKRTLAAALLSGALFLAACDSEPTGQVAAVVNGEEITLQEINAELALANVPEGADEEEVRRAVLARVIDRRLLSQAAREDGLDQTPEYLIRKRQLEDALLVQLLRQREERAAEVPDEAAIDQFIAENAAAFAERELYVIDRIQFPRTVDRSVLDALESAQTMDQVAATLNELGVEFAREPARMDSASLPQEVIDRIKELPAGEPFILPEGTNYTVGVIRETERLATSPEQARPQALQAMRNRNINEALERRLEAERAGAEITYQSGFGPVADEAATDAAGPE